MKDVLVSLTDDHLFLSQLARPARRAILDSLTLTRFTDHTIIHKDMLDAELDRIEASQVSLDNEEYLAGLIPWFQNHLVPAACTE